MDLLGQLCANFFGISTGFIKIDLKIQSKISSTIGSKRPLKFFTNVK